MLIYICVNYEIETYTIRTSGSTPTGVVAVEVVLQCIPPTPDPYHYVVPKNLDENNTGYKASYTSMYGLNVTEIFCVQQKNCFVYEKCS